ncbi:MAG TPA: carboxypeptidase-like regulatory domain-containing protein [Gemmatimonadaceae bacterium]
MGSEQFRKRVVFGSNLFVLTGGILLHTPELAAQATELRGRVVTVAGEPVVDATVTIVGVRYTVRTDSLGRFHLAGTPGSTLTLSLQASGFRDETATVVLSRGRPVVRDFALVSESSPEIEATRAYRTLKLRVTTTDGESIAYANLQVNGGRRYVSTDSGLLTLPVTFSSPATLLVRRIGFEPTEIQLAGLPDTVIQVPMKPVATTLATQRITVRSPFVRLDLGGFYRRMAEVQNGARVGYFVTPEDLELRKPQNVTDAVEQFPSIRLAPIDDGKRDASGLNHADGAMARRKFRIEDSSGCPMTVYLDRVRIQPRLGGREDVDEEINALVSPGIVAGIEVYPRAAGAPPEFPPYRKTAGNCGVVLIWTR